MNEQKIEPVKREKLTKLCLEILEGRQMTAREIAVVLKNKYGILNGMRQDTQPRLTELQGSGKVIVCGKKVDQMTKKVVSVYEVCL